VRYGHDSNLTGGGAIQHQPTGYDGCLRHLAKPQEWAKPALRLISHVHHGPWRHLLPRITFALRHLKAYEFFADHGVYVAIIILGVVTSEALRENCIRAIFCCMSDKTDQSFDCIGILLGATSVKGQTRQPLYTILPTSLANVKTRYRDPQCKTNSTIANGDRRGNA
jgi:hypothetical protein